MTATAYAPGYVIAGKYELESLIGEGGMGMVWRARNVALDAPVAIKVVRASADRTLLRGRLMQEARAAAKLTHPAIVKVFDIGQTESGDPFIVMELLEGSSLGAVLTKDGRLPAVQAVRLLLPIADALWLAHDKGIVHRDLKPDNVFVVQHEGGIQPTLVDFGIVKIEEAGGSDTHLTKAGDVVGSPDYMSPEQARGLDHINHLTDVWSFCVVLYETITGETPFEGANYNALLRQIVEDTPRTLVERSLADAELSAIVARGLSKVPGQRFQSMGELGRALANWLLAQGVSEDICGTSLEAKWQRAVEERGRVGRASLASFVDWPIEGGSGVRRNVLSQPTLKGPAAARAPAPVEPSPSKRRSRVWLAGAVVVLIAGVAGAGLLLGRSKPEAARASSSAVSALGPAPAAPLSVAVVAQTALPSAAETAQPAPEALSSAPRQPVAAAASGGKLAPKLKRGQAPATRKGRSGDLMSPY
jgi:serine/threonine protein kinase